MTQKQIIAKKKGNPKGSTRWSDFKDKLSGTFTKSTDALIMKSMASSNVGTTIDLIGSVSGETQKEALEWLKTNGRYHNGMTKSIYNKAMKEDGIWTELFVDAYQKADESEKSRLWNMMDRDLNTLLTRVEFCDMIDVELRNASRLYSEIGKIDEHANPTVCWDALRELVEGKGGNSIEVRKFALDALYASDYNEIKFWSALVSQPGNGENNELAKHALKRLLREETIGTEELLLKNLDEVAERLVEMENDEDLNRKRLMAFFPHAILNGEDEKVLHLMHVLNESNIPMMLLNTEMETALKKLIGNGMALNPEKYGEVNKKSEKLQKNLRNLNIQRKRRLGILEAEMKKKMEHAEAHTENEEQEEYEITDETVKKISAEIAGIEDNISEHRKFLSKYKSPKEIIKTAIGLLFSMELRALVRFIKETITQDRKEYVKKFDEYKILQGKLRELKVRKKIRVEKLEAEKKLGKKVEFDIYSDSVIEKIDAEMDKTAQEISIPEEFLKDYEKHMEMTEAAFTFMKITKWWPNNAKEELFEAIEKGIVSVDITKTLIGRKIPDEEAERIMAVIFKRMKKSKSTSEHAGVYMYIQSMAQDEDEQVRMNVSTGLERLSKKDELVEKMIVKGFLLNARDLAKSNVIMELRGAMNLMETLEFTGKTEQIKKVIENKVKTDVKTMIEKMFESPEIAQNIQAANVLLALSQSNEAKKLIKETAIPELKDIAEDEDSSDSNRYKARKKISELEEVIVDE